MRQPDEVTDEEIARTLKALCALPRIATSPIAVGLGKGDVRDAIAAGLLVPPCERTQMEKDEDEWRRRLMAPGPWTKEDARTFSLILCDLFHAAKAAGVTY